MREGSAVKLTESSSHDIRELTESTAGSRNFGARSRKSDFHLAVRELGIGATAVGERSGASQTEISQAVHRRERSVLSQDLNLGDERAS